MLTGGGRKSDESGGKSLDNFLAEKLGQGARFSQVTLGALTSAWGGSRQTRMSYSGPDEFVPPNDDPKDAFDKIFGVVAGGQQPQMDESTLARKRILDVMKGVMRAMQKALGQRKKSSWIGIFIRSVS